MIYKDLAHVLMSRGNHVFWHSVATHTTSNLERDLVDSFPANVVASWTDCRNLPVDANGDLMADKLDLSGDIVCIVNVDFLLRLRRGAALLRQLRPPAMAALDRGCRLLVMSNRPQGDFPVIDGSMIVHDALPAQLQRLSDGDFRTYAPLSVCSERQRATLLKSAKGFRGAVSRMCERVEITNGNAQIPDRLERESILVEVVSDSLVELGDSVVGTILGTVDSVGRRIHCDDLDERCYLRTSGAGLSQMDRATDEVLFFPGLNDGLVRRAVALADMKTTSSDLWNQVVENVFIIERSLRQLLGRRMAGISESDFVDARRDEISRNWRQDSSIPDGDESTGPISPLNYVNLSDLFDLARDMSAKRHLGGISSSQWRELADDVLPIRNRVGHMRLPSTMDLDVSRRWRKVLSRALEA